MRELALHVLDLVQNALEAGAKQVILEIVEDSVSDVLIIRVIDNGCGISEELQKRILDPFVTTRVTRIVGLGLPLLDMTTRQCGGYLNIKSKPGAGTTVEASFKHSNIDRPPLGRLAETVKAIIIANPNLDFIYQHTVNGSIFRVTTRELREALGDVPLTRPEVIDWLESYLAHNLANLYGGVVDENP
jgi:hypothetical protein